MKRQHARRSSARSAALLVARDMSRGIEHLETRQMLTSTPWPLSAANPLSQNWETTDFTAANDWSVAPSIEGYGTGGNIAAGNDPGSLTTATDVGALNIAINQTNPTTYSSGGLAEFQLATPVTGTGGVTTGSRTVAFQASGNANFQSPNLKIYVDSTAVSMVHVAFDTLDIDAATAPGGQQRVALQWRANSTLPWQTVTSVIAAPNDGTTGTVNSISTDLPAGAAGQAGLQIRIMTADAVGAGGDQEVAIENIVISNAAITAPGTFALANSTLTTTENVGTYNIVVNRTGGSTGAATVDYAITPGSAQSPADFTVAAGLTGTLSFADGQTSKSIAVTIVNDTLVEGTENFTVALSNATTASLGTPNSATVAITDDDVAGTYNFSASTATVAENAAGGLTLTVLRTGGINGPATVGYKTTDGTALDGSDYNGTQTGTITFADQQQSATINIPLINDGNPENNETFTVTLTSATNSGIIGTTAVATVTITDDDVVGDPGVITFNPVNVTVNESAGTATLTLKRSGITGAVTVDYATADGIGSHGAVSPGDYAAKTGTATFADGSDTTTIVITINNDNVAEPTETFTVSLLNPTNGATIGSDSTATVTITDDDVVLPTGVYINEAFIDPPSTNPPKQFIELKGAPGASLTNLVLMQIEGDFEQGAGQLDFVLDLSGSTFGSNGLLLVTAATNGWTPQDAATNVLTTSLLDATTIGFEVGSYSFVLTYRVPSTDPLPTLGTDFDSDDTKDASGLGTLDALPADYSVIDGFGTTDGGANDIRYVTSLPALAAGGSADAVVRISNTVGNASAFYYGIIAGASGNTTLTFTTTTTQRSTNFPAGVGIVTPGAVNAGVVATPPTVVSTVFDAKAGQKVVVTFSDDVGASIAATDFTLTRTGNTPTNVTLAVNSISADGKTVTLTFANTGGVTPNVLLDGNYTFTTRGGQVSAVGGGVLASDATQTFKFLNADFNVDNSVGFTDLVALAQNYGKPSGATFAQGDANYDGKVDFSDLVILAQRYGNLGQLAAMLALPTDPTPTKDTTKKDGQIGEVVSAAATPVVTTKAIGTKTTIK